MASNITLPKWADNTTNLYDFDEYENLLERSTGFVPNTTASSKLVNTILKVHDNIINGLCSAFDKYVTNQYELNSLSSSDDWDNFFTDYAETVQAKIDNCVKSVDVTTSTFNYEYVNYFRFAGDVQDNYFMRIPMTTGGSTFHVSMLHYCNNDDGRIEYIYLSDSNTSISSSHLYQKIHVSNAHFVDLYAYKYSSTRCYIACITDNQYYYREELSVSTDICIHLGLVDTSSSDVNMIFYSIAREQIVTDVQADK